LGAATLGKRGDGDCEGGEAVAQLGGAE
jgi:hypothetical protein